MAARPHTSQGWRNLPATPSPIDPRIVSELLRDEWETFSAQRPVSAAAHRQALRSLPLGVPSSFQHWDPYPITVDRAEGAWAYDVDGRRYLDLNMGFGALLVGHLHPAVVAACQDALANGMLFVAPSPLSSAAGAALCRRFALDQVRFTNSGTEATMDAIRLARGYTGRRYVVKVEGGYHGHADAVLVSNKPSLDSAGDARRPNAVPSSAGLCGWQDTLVVPYNDAEALAELLQAHSGDVAAFIVEPVLENIGIVLPDEDYLAQVRSLCDLHGVVLIFDEVKTGLTAGVGGATARLGVRPDLVTLAKSIGGGVPVGAFGGRAEIMAAITDNRVPQLGTYNGNSLAMAAVLAVDGVCTEAALDDAKARNERLLSGIDALIATYELPAHTVGFGAKGCMTWSSTAVRNYRDYKQVDFDTAELTWLWGINRGVLTPAGLDEQWLVSLAHTDEHLQVYLDSVNELAVALRR